MADYIDIGLTADATSLYDTALETLTALAPDDWTPSPIEQWLLEAVARIGVEITLVAGTVPLQIFEYFGSAVLGIPALDATPATGTVTFTTIDTAGHTIVAGAQLDIDGVAFTTDTELDIPSGESTGSVTATALDAGTDANDLAGDQVDLTSPSYLFIDTIVLDEPTAGGDDGETGQEYADRLADELPTLSPKAILIGDFEALARRNPAVGRALAIDNYNPVGPDPAAEGHVSIVAHDEVGQPLPGPVKSDIAATLSASRVLNISTHVLDPTYSTVDVAFTITLYDGFDSTTVSAAAVDAVTTLLDPTRWGSPNFADTSEWIDETTLYRSDLIGAVKNVDGVRHVTALTVGLPRPITAAASTDLVTLTAHGLSSGDAVTLSGLTGGAPLAAGTTYYVRDVTTNTFKLAATSGGTAIDITTNLTAGQLHHLGSADLTLTGPGALPAAGTITPTVA